MYFSLVHFTLSLSLPFSRSLLCSLHLSFLFHYYYHYFFLNSLFLFFSVVLFYTHIRYNGFLPQGDKGRRRSKFVLFKRPEANGVRRSRHYIVQSPQTSKAILDANQHSISYTLSRNQAVIVEYKEDADTDMFQVNIYKYIHHQYKHTFMRYKIINWWKTRGRHFIVRLQFIPI